MQIDAFELTYILFGVGFGMATYPFQLLNYLQGQGVFHLGLVQPTKCRREF